jgi:hypothetical protein
MVHEYFMMKWTYQGTVGYLDYHSPLGNIPCPAGEHKSKNESEACPDLYQSSIPRGTSHHELEESLVSASNSRPLATFSGCIVKAKERNAKAQYISILAFRQSRTQKRTIILPM